MTPRSRWDWEPSDLLWCCSQCLCALPVDEVNVDILWGFDNTCKRCCATCLALAFKKATATNRCSVLAGGISMNRRAARTLALANRFPLVKPCA